MHPAQINAALTLAGSSQTDLAKEIGRDRSRVNAVVNNNSQVKDIRKAIAKTIGKEVKEIWPDEQYRRANGRIVVPLQMAA